MRLSTTINFFIEPDISSLEACARDMRMYARVGFTNLDAIFCGAGDKNSPLRAENWLDWVKRIRDIAEDEGITFVQSHVPFYNFIKPAPGTPDDIDEMVTRSIISAGVLGAKWTVAHPATAPNAPMPTEDSKAANIEYFSRHLETARNHSVGIAIENMADFEGGGRKRYYCARVEELTDLIDTLAQKYPNVGACWDFGHANLVYADQSRALIELGDRLKVTHVHDNSGERDEHLSPFRGNVEWLGIMRTLKRFYKRDFSFEVKRIVRTDVPDEIKNSIWEHLRKVGDFLLSVYDEAK